MLAAVGWFTNEITPDDARTLLSSGAVLLLSARRLVVPAANANMPPFTASISFGVLIGFVAAYWLGIMNYIDMAYGVVGSLGIVGIEHKVRKLKRYNSDVDEEWGGYETENDPSYESRPYKPECFEPFDNDDFDNRD